MSLTLTQDPVAAQLGSSEAAARLAAILRLCEPPPATLSEAALDALVRCAGADTKAEQRRAADALAAAAIHDSRVAGRLRMALSGASARARWGAAYALGLIADALDVAALPALAEALANRDGDVRWAAAELMVRLGRCAPELVIAELKRLACGGEPNARRMALYCLRDLGAPADDLLALADSCCADADPLLRLAAVSMVSRLHGADERRAAFALRLLQSDPQPGVRRAAAAALGQVGNRSQDVVEALRRAAQDCADASLKRSAEAALRRLGL